MCAQVEQQRTPTGYPRTADKMSVEDDPSATNREHVDHDWSNDLVLRALQDLEEPVGSFVRAFPGRAGLADEPDWLESCFLDLATRFKDGEGPDLKEIVVSAAEGGDLSLLAKEPVESTLRLLALRPHWFRGFREVPEPIRFEADLVVFEGRNSSGKTSISEAIEWVFTGQLSRRTSGEQGHATELADCIANEFRPAGESTSVELTVSVNGAPLVLKRVLRKDYSTVAAEAPKSELFVDGDSVDSAAERDLFDALLAGVHPILMQHNLRRFVHDDPSARRKYFERLLQIDELTALVEKAVIGRKRLKEILNPAGGTGLAALRDLANEVQSSGAAGGAKASKQLRKIENADAGEVPAELASCLIAIADEFLGENMEGASGLPAYRIRIEESQRRQRESRLPLLADLESAGEQPAPAAAPLTAAAAELTEALAAMATAKEAAGQVEEAQQQVARATDLLIEAGLLDPEADSDQLCPVCENGFLSPGRMQEIASWGPLTRAIAEASARRSTAAVKVEQEIGRLKRAIASVASVPVEQAEADRQFESLPGRAEELGRQALLSADRVRTEAAALEATAARIEARVTEAASTVEDVEAAVAELQAAIAEFADPISVHRHDVEALQEAVGAASRDDAGYRLREKWLKAATLTAAIAEDVAWEGAKAQGSTALDGLREGLIELRTQIVEDARQTFSEEMTAVWALLREDSGASFSQLHVPPARGRGFKLEFELKASISDGKVESEVDALRVFSESQVNVVGIAAYVTRANRLGHKLLIFDDPVQSMDEEHFRSFATRLLPALIESGHQVVILTHSHAFGACVHEHHYDRESYATLTTRFSKRKGCCVDEGNRRATERLKLAEKAAEDGDLARAWRLVRLAVERMYLLVKIKSNGSFKPETWSNHSADAMWNEGVGELVEEAAPGHAKRLKEIVDSTVPGAHDKPATSETDLRAAVRDLRTLLDPLRLGDG